MLRSIVDQARQGDEEAFGALVREVGDRCIFIAHRILRDADLAEDAVQVTLVQVWRQLPALRDLERFEAWLHRILVNACYAEARRNRRFAANVVLLETDEPAAGDEYLTVHDRDQLDRGFRRLPPEQRAVLVFHHALGLTLPEVADHLGIPLGTAKSEKGYAVISYSSVVPALDAFSRSRLIERGELLLESIAYSCVRADIAQPRTAGAPCLQGPDQRFGGIAANDLVICPRLRLGDEIVGTVTLVARFGATREVTLDELRVALIFLADEAAEAHFRRAALTAV